MQYENQNKMISKLVEFKINDLESNWKITEDRFFDAHYCPHLKLLKNLFVFKRYKWLFFN